MTLVPMKQVGDIKFVTRAIVGAVFFTLLFLTANTMRQSVRDRTSEFGVLKSVGFSDGAILWLIFAEAGCLRVRGGHRTFAGAAGAPLVEGCWVRCAVRAQLLARCRGRASRFMQRHPARLANRPVERGRRAGGQVTR